MINNISVVVLAKNSEITIKDTLDSLIIFNDVVVYDNGSTDSTIDIAKSYKNVNLVCGDFNGFGWTKNKAASYSRNDWVLIIDSDEVLDNDFIANIKTLKPILGNTYSINRINFYKQYRIKHCWANDVITRLYNKSETSFKELDVHEYIIETKLNNILLDGLIQHYPYQTIEQFVNKANTYSTLFAKNNAGKKKSSPLKAILNGIYSFIKTYFFKQGFRDGYIGLIIAFSHMTTNFYKYIKLYELNNLNDQTKQDK